MEERNPYAPPQAAVADPERLRKPKPKPEPESDELASRWARFGGSLLDGVVTLVVIAPLLYFSGYWDSIYAGTVSMAATFGIAIVNFVLFCAVNGYWLATAGQTVGKRLVGTRIVSTADGRVPTLFAMLGLRYGLLYLVSAIPLIGNVYSLVDPLFIFRADKRCVHDLIAGTKVVKA